MERAITGFRPDDEADWVAYLDCGHRQHVRHRPPFQDRAWVLDRAGREGRIGRPLECPLCDRNELPDDLEPIRSTPTWDVHTMPAGLKSEHRLAAGVWAVLTLDQGSGALHWRDMATALEAGVGQPIPPAVPHRLELDEGARFHLDMWRVRPFGGEGGEGACLAHLVCPDCGVVAEPGAEHRPGCPAAPVG